MFCYKALDKAFELSSKHPIYYNIHGSIHLSKQEYYLIKDSADSNIEFDHIEHFSGGFLILNKNDSVNFINISQKVFDCCKRNDIVSGQGDEFILSLALRFMGYDKLLDNSFSSIAWTGTIRILDKFLNDSDCAVIHLPSEKKTGFNKMFRYICKHKQLPNTEKAFSIFHIYKPSIITMVKIKVKSILDKIKK